MNNLLLFAGSASLNLGQLIGQYMQSQAGHQGLGKSHIISFSDGEIKPKFDENIRGRDIVIVQSTYTPAENLWELLLWLDAAKRASAKQKIAAIPYFGYSRQERKDESRVPISAKLVAQIIELAGADRFITMDLHSPAVQGFFNIPVDHIYASYILIPQWREILTEKVAVVAPDVGAVKMARSWAKRLGADLIIINKRRTGIDQTEVAEIIGNAHSKHLLIVDDIISTATTLNLGIRALIKRKPLSINICGIHPVMSGKALELLTKLYEEGLIQRILVTDSIPLKPEAPKWIEVCSIAPLFGEVIMRAYRNESINSLFDREEIKG